MAKKLSQTAAAKRARANRAARNDEPAGLSGAGETIDTPASAKATETESEHASEASANAASEIARRRHEPGAADPEKDGPDVGRVDNRVDTSFETQGIPRPARPLTPVGATADRIAPGAAIDEDPINVDAGFPKKVRAIAMGYYRHSRRRAGDVFLIYSAKEFSSRWMEYAGSNDPEKITSGQQELERQRRSSIEDQIAKKKARGTGDADVLGNT